MMNVAEKLCTVFSSVLLIWTWTLQVIEDSSFGLNILNSNCHSGCTSYELLREVFGLIYKSSSLSRGNVHIYRCPVGQLFCGSAWTEETTIKATRADFKGELL